MYVDEEKNSSLQEWAFSMLSNPKDQHQIHEYKSNTKSTHWILYLSVCMCV